MCMCVGVVCVGVWVWCRCVGVCWVCMRKLGTQCNSCASKEPKCTHIPEDIHAFPWLCTFPQLLNQSLTAGLHEGNHLKWQPNNIMYLLHSFQLFDLQTASPFSFCQWKKLGRAFAEPSSTPPPLLVPGLLEHSSLSPGSWENTAAGVNQQTQFIVTSLVPRPVFAYCKRSKTDSGNGLGTRLHC